jgi:glycosyltransferase involved in cell wall biosynthesis
MRSIVSRQALGLERGSLAICIPVSKADELTFATVRSIAGNTDSSLPIILIGQVAMIELIAGRIAKIDGDRLLGLAIQQDRGAVLGEVVRVTAPADLAVVLPGIIVAPEWLERLRRAAISDSTIASATPLSFDCIAVGSSEGLLGRYAQRVAERSLHLYPKISVMGPGCVYIRRMALELAGLADESLALENALADLAFRLTAKGMVHVLADDVLVEDDTARHPRDGSNADTSQTSDQARETVDSDERGSLRRAVNWARATLRGLSVTIDGRALTPMSGGTQTYIIELILALGREHNVAVRVLIPPDLSERAAQALASVPEVELLTYEQAINDPPLTDVVHRPQQVFTPDDLTLLRLIGERVVIGQQDLIAYHNPSYHPDVDTWRAYRRTTRLALAGADQAIFFSEHARCDVLIEDLLPPGRTHVVGVGAEAAESRDLPESSPEGVEVDDPFLLCLGADYAHKNRPFAIELLGALRGLGWTGRLAFAGAHVPYGSSRQQEQELLVQRPDLAPFVIDLGPVDEPSRNWLYSNARALVYPTLYEGFGLIPLEAARAGLPCLFASQASLEEVAGGAATLIPWDAAASAAAVLPLLSDGRARDSHLAELRALSIPSWDDVARQLTAVYEHALAAPASEAAPRVSQELDRENYILKLGNSIADLKQTAQEYQDAYHRLEARVSIGLPLIDEGGLLSHDQQRGLMRVASRGWLGSLALMPFGLLGHIRDEVNRGHRTSKQVQPQSELPPDASGGSSGDVY